MCCYEIVRLEYKMSSSSANGASTIYILSPSLALVCHHFCQIHQYSLICILHSVTVYTEESPLFCVRYFKHMFSGIAGKNVGIA